MSILDDVDEIGALYGNSEDMRFIGDGVLAVESVSARCTGRVHDHLS
jgi:hypothetical protein